VLIPLLVQRAFTGWTYSNFNYTLIQLPNWAWTLIEVGRAGVTTTKIETTIFVAIIGGLIFLANFLLAAREARHTRQLAPHRVLEDELALHPAAASRKKRNPWDN